MKFNLERDLIFFDIESTGLNVMRDRILQIAFIKYPKDGGDPIELEMMINPGIPIAEEAMNVHGITPDMLRNKPSFKDVAEKLFNFIGTADLSGYNSDRFDIPMLMEEFNRYGYDLEIEKRRTIDVQKIFYKMEPRTLKAALKFYCNKSLTDAHNALADVKATVDVLKGQLEKYDGVDYVDGDDFVTPAPIKNDVKALSEFTHNNRMVDVTQRLKYNPEGEIVFNFGKYAGKKVREIISNDKQYYAWIMEKDFSVQVKKAVKRIMDDILRERAQQQK
jgi:DNA polymerase-3 subunit epsilon